MKVEGFVSYDSANDTNLPSDPNFQVLSLPNGYISYPFGQLDKKFSFDFTLFVNDSAIVSQISSPKSVGEDIDFYNLRAPSFKKSNLDYLGLGIWFDETSQTIQIYREIFGQIPLFYVFVPNQFLSFSTSLTSLLKMKSVRENLTPDTSTIVEYSNFGAVSAKYYSEHTFYNEVKAALPGHITTFTCKTVKVDLNISFNTSKWRSLSSLEEYGEAFSSLFQQSVKELIANEINPVASHLSGGLDSSSISAVSRQLFPARTLHTLYAFTGTKPSDETYYANLVAKKIGSVHHEVTPSLNYVESLLSYTSLYGHPERLVLAGTFQGTMMKHAQNLGAGTLLMGHAGDSIVGSGFSVIHEAFINRNWKLVNELLAQRALNVSYHPEFNDWVKFTDKKKYSLISRHYLFKELPGMYKKLPHNEFVSLVKDLHQNTALSFDYFLSELTNLIIKKISKKDNRFSTFSNHDIGLQQPRQETSSYSENSFWASGIHTAQAIGFNEEAFVLGHHYGLKIKFPFYNKELYELSLAVPEITKFDNGRGRGHLRQAMKDILPEEVRNRTDKGKFGIYNNIAVLEIHKQSQDFLRPANEVWNYLDRQKFQTAIKSIEANKNVDNSNALLVLRAISLSVWLYLFKNKGFV